MRIRDENRHQIKKAVIYARVSGKKQMKNGDGLGSQERRCRAYAKVMGYSVERVFTDGRTGRVANRPGMNDMMRFLDANRDDPYVVIIDDLNRFARRVKVHFELRHDITEAGGILELPSVRLSDDAEGELREHMMATMAQYDARKNGEQAKNRMHARLCGGYWVFPKTIGYKYVSGHGPGRCLVPNEPYASLIREGLASGRFQTQAEVRRFFESQPAFPKNKYGRVTAQRVKEILTRVIYSGYVEYGKWGVSLRDGYHEGLITLKTHQRIQERLNGRPVAPARPDLNKEFPLRGVTSCGDCGSPLTGAFSRSKTGVRHPYYFCHKRSCVSHRKSIRRADLEGEFTKILETMQPSHGLFEMVRAIFKDAWEMRLEQINNIQKDCQRQMADVDKQIHRLVDRMIDTQSETVIGALEQRVEKLELEKQVLAEKIGTGTKPKHTFDEMFELALEFLSSPLKLWDSGHLALRRTVLKLAFTKGLVYDRKKGFRTPENAFPFKALEGVFGGDCSVGAPGKIRTPDPQIRSLVLYPAELPAQASRHV